MNIDLVNALLCDENGISESAYILLLESVDAELSKQIRINADATDGRFYFSNPIERA